MVLSVGIVEPDDGGGGARNHVVPRGVEGHAGDGAASVMVLNAHISGSSSRSGR